MRILVVTNVKPQQALGARMKSVCQCGKSWVDIHSDEHVSINCHCGMCRAGSGAAFTTWVMIKVDQVDIGSRHGDLSIYKVSENLKRYFCAHCGTPVFVLDKRFPDYVAFCAGTLKEIEVKPPEGEYFYDDKASWYCAESNTQKYGGESGDEAL